MSKDLTPLDAIFPSADANGLYTTEQLLKFARATIRLVEQGTSITRMRKFLLDKARASGCANVPEV